MIAGTNDMSDPAHRCDSKQSALMSCGPDWDRIPFDVPCTRCGANLHGRSQPVCPACGLRFNWDHVLPLDTLRCQECAYRLFGLPEPRCPECGTAFHWAEALAIARSRSSRLFEFVWLSDPLRGFFRSTWLAAFRPNKLWAQYVPRVPPKIAPLLLFILVQWLVFAGGWHAVAWGADPLMNGIARWIGSPLSFTYRFRVDALFLPAMAGWHIVTFASIQLLFQTKRRRGIRWRDTLRVYAHATVLTSFCPAAWCLLEMLLDATLFVSPALRDVSAAAYPLLAKVVFVVGVTATWVYLWIGLQRHLKIPRGWLVAAACLLIGYLISGSLAF
jgi:hypothetical protein